MESPPRLVWVDVLRGVAIALVLLGHAPGTGDEAKTLIYAFHMPLFFIVSGYLTSSRRLAEGFSSFALSQARRLLVPYAVFSLVSYPVWLLARTFGKETAQGISPLRPLLGTLYGIGTDHWLTHNMALWFFPCLFTARLLFYWVHRLDDMPLMAAALVVLAALGAWSAQLDIPRLPFGLEPALMGAAFLGAGFLARGFASDALTRSMVARIAGFTTSLALLLVLARVNGRVDLNGARYGNPLAFVGAALAGTAACALAARSELAARVPLLARAGANTAAIFPMHLPFFTLLTGAAVVGMGLPRSFNEEMWLAPAAYTLAGLLVLTPVGDLLRRRAPWLLGELPPNRASGGGA